MTCHVRAEPTPSRPPGRLLASIAAALLHATAPPVRAGPDGPATPVAAPDTAPVASAAPALPPLAVPLPFLLEALTGWVAETMDRPAQAEPPRIAFASAAGMDAIRRAAAGEAAGEAADEAGRQDHPIAIYDTRDGTIYLPHGWRGTSAAEVSILVHALVHHFQSAAGERFACPAAREKDAFRLRALWLATFGETLQTAMGIDGLYLIFATSCLFRAGDRGRRRRVIPAGRRARSWGRNRAPSPPPPPGPAPRAPSVRRAR